MINERLYEDDDPHKSVGPLCDILHCVDEMTLRDMESELLVTEEKLVQVLSRADGDHKFIEDIMWKIQL